jgi:hypothetical protein
MSILTSNLKNDINFRKKINVYIKKEKIDVKQLKELKLFHCAANSNDTITNCIKFFVYHYISKDLDLFKQLSYEKDIYLILDQITHIENTSSYTELTTNYYKVSIPLWHLIFCLKSKELSNSNGSIEDIIISIISFNCHICSNLFPERFL